jgi:tRNA(Ile)-lysidine synthase
MAETSRTGDPWQRFKAEIAESWPPMRWRDVGVVIGCSGGADSVALLAALSDLRQTPSEMHPNPPRGFLVAAHFNHGLRQDESDEDEAFVHQLATERGTRFTTRRGLGTHRDEATMRTERLQFLTETASDFGARYVALAHSATDNVETVLHHLMRGTGPAGLAGIGNPRSIDRDLVLVRPILHVPRDVIRDALQSAGQTWREDSSNSNTDYRRNWIRHRLIPLIESEYPSAVDAIGRAIDGQRGWRTVIDRLARDWLAAHRRCDQPLTLRRDSSAELPIVVAATQILWTELGWSRGEMTREHWLRLVQTIQGQTQERYALPAQIEVITRGDEVELSIVREISAADRK